LVTVTAHVQHNIGKLKTNYIYSPDGATNEYMVQSVNALKLDYGFMHR